MHPNPKDDHVVKAARRVWAEKIKRAHHRVGLLDSLPPEVDGDTALQVYAAEFERLRRILRDTLKAV